MQGDESPMPVSDPDTPGANGRGWWWTYSTPRGSVSYDFARTRGYDAAVGSRAIMARCRPTATRSTTNSITRVSFTFAAGAMPCAPSINWPQSSTRMPPRVPFAATPLEPSRPSESFTHTSGRCAKPMRLPKIASPIAKSIACRCFPQRKNRNRPCGELARQQAGQGVCLCAWPVAKAHPHLRLWRCGV